MSSQETAGSDFTGTFYARGEEGYEAARRAAVWNGRKPRRFPEKILIAHTARDVVEGVRLAEKNGHRIGIRSGGHSVVATGVREGGMLVDVSRLKDIEVDAATKTAWIGPGVLVRELGRCLGREGLAFPYGGSASVGLGGFILSGGYGLNGKTYGSAAGNIKAIDVVTADGELIRADETTNSEYLWAARGGGYGFFGVVVRFQLQLYDAPGHLTKTDYVFSVDDFEAFASWFLASLHAFDDKLMTLVFGQSLPGHAEHVVHLVGLAFADDPAESRELLRPLRESPVAQLALAVQDPAPVTVEDIWVGNDLLYPEGARYFADTAWIDDPTDPGLITALKEAFTTLPTPGSHIMMNPWKPEEHLEGALSGTSRLPVHLYGVCDDPSDDDRVQQWISANMPGIAASSNGIGKVNESDLQLRDQHVLAPDSAAHLEELRSRLDPEQRFHSFLRPEA